MEWLSGSIKNNFNEMKSRLNFTILKVYFFKGNNKILNHWLLISYGDLKN